jgi:hypothetical protein
VGSGAFLHSQYRNTWHLNNSSPVLQDLVALNTSTEVVYTNEQIKNFQLLTALLISHFVEKLTWIQLYTRASIPSHCFYKKDRMENVI